MAAKFSELAVNRSMRLIVRGLAAGRLTTVAEGLEHIPASGPALIVARHYHHLYDGLALFAAIQRPFHVLVTLDWAANRWIKTLMTGLTRTARWPALLRADAVARGGVNIAAAYAPGEVLRYQRRAVREAVGLLVEGRILVVFPEGYPNIDPHYTTKTTSDEFLPFKPGFLRIAMTAERRLGSEIPIIPAGFHYIPGSPWKAYLRFGPGALRARWEPSLLIAHLESDVKNLSAPHN